MIDPEAVLAAAVMEAKTATESYAVTVAEELDQQVRCDESGEHLDCREAENAKLVARAEADKRWDRAVRIARLVERNAAHEEYCSMEHDRKRATDDGSLFCDERARLLRELEALTK